MIAAAVQERLRSAIEDRAFPGCVIGVVRADGCRQIIPLGHHTYQRRLPTAADTIYDVASVTKVIPTSSLALMLVDQGVLSLDQCVHAFLPKLNHTHADTITVRHLLTQTLEFDFALASLKHNAPEEILNAIMTRELKSPPGQRFGYANATSILLGLLVERIAGEPLDILAEERLFGPLGMIDTTFSPGTDARVVPTEQDPWRGRAVRAEIHDESAWKLRRIMVPGSAGVFSTVPDLLSFLAVLLNRGDHNDVRLFSSAMVEQMGTDQLSGTGQSTGLGWEHNQPHWMGQYSRELVGKTGFTGCCVMCSARLGLGLVLLSNSTWPRRRPDRNAINTVRRDLADLVFGA